MSAGVRVVLCDEHAPARACARRVLESCGRFEIVGEAADGPTGVALARELRPALVLMDVMLPELRGSEVIRRILAADPSTKVLAFSSDAKWEAVEEMFAAGARGYVVKSGIENEILLGALAVISGGFFISPGIQRTTRD